MLSRHKRAVWSGLLVLEPLIGCCGNVDEPWFFSNHSLNFSELITVGAGGVGRMRAMCYIWAGHLQEFSFVDQSKGLASGSYSFLKNKAKRIISGKKKKKGNIDGIKRWPFVEFLIIKQLQFWRSETNYVKTYILFSLTSRQQENMRFIPKRETPFTLQPKCDKHENSLLSTNIMCFHNHWFGPIN